MKSRVNREVQARFREGLGVKFPGATRQLMRAGEADWDENRVSIPRVFSEIV